MDSSAVNVNLTVDDFDSVLSYADQSVWQTPDPSSSTFNPSGSPWLMGTYHTTDVVNASLSFNFTGASIDFSPPFYVLTYRRTCDLHLRKLGSCLRVIPGPS